MTGLDKRGWAEQWVDDNEAHGVMLFDGLDDAIMGISTVYTRPTRIVYSYNKIIEILMRDMPYEDAVEYFDFNISCLWAGEGTPAILYEPEEL